MSGLNQQFAKLPYIKSVPRVQIPPSPQVWTALQKGMSIFFFFNCTKMQHNLSEINEIIRHRRTVYPEQFSERKVHKEIILNLLENARWAPTHGLTQPWFFKIFFGNGIKKIVDFHSQNINEKFNQQKFEKLKSRAEKASAIIAVCMKRQETEKIPEIEEVEAVACAVQNMFLTATAHGIGFYWGSGGLTYSEKMKYFLKLKEKDKCLGFIFLGYPSVKPQQGQRKPLEYYTEWVEE